MEIDGGENNMSDRIKRPIPNLKVEEFGELTDEDQKNIIEFTPSDISKLIKYTQDINLSEEDMKQQNKSK